MIESGNIEDKSGPARRDILTGEIVRGELLYNSCLQQSFDTPDN